MNEIFHLPETMIWPLLACLVLTGIHVYLGVHVIARKVIFVDLALAQIAALGTVVGILLGYEAGTDSTALYLYSLAFTIFGAFVFSMTRMRGERVPHEAIIGIVYAVTFASTILVLSKSALGPQELDHILKGELLWVQPQLVIKTAIIYSIVGVFHYIFRRQFMALSFDAQEAEVSGLNVKLWDFLFYMSFGFVITSSVAIAGVFLVFSYLIIPAVGAMLLSDKLGTRLLIGWVGGSIISLIGVKVSYSTGLPTSPIIVVVLAIGLIASGIYSYLKAASEKTRAIRNLLAATAVVTIFITGVLFFEKAEEDPLEHAIHMLGSPLSTDRRAALGILQSFTGSKAQWIPLVEERLRDRDVEVRKAAIELLVRVHEHDILPKILKLLADPSTDVRLRAVDAARTLGDITTADHLLQQAYGQDDPEIKTRMLQAALDLGHPEAIPPIIDLIREEGIFADDAYQTLQSHLTFPFKRHEIERIDDWWNENRDRLRWDQQRRVFLEE